MEPADELVQRATRLLGQTRTFVERTQAMLTHVQALQAALEQLRADLTAHDEQLQAALGRQSSAAPIPGPFVEPAAALFPWEVSAEKEAETPGLISLAVDRPERRAASRRGGNPVAIIIRTDAQQEPASSGWVLDRSPGGLGLLAKEPASVGTTLLVRPSNGDETPWVQVEVRYCQPLGSCWRLGCRFMDHPALEPLRLFG